MENLQQDLHHLVVQHFVAWLPSLGAALALFVFFAVVARVAHFAVLRLVRRKHAHVALAELLASVTHVSLVGLGVVTALGTLGVNIQGLVAGLGLTGFALGFALKDSISNVLAGVLILLYRPFEVGDRIDVGGLAGRVAHVDLRYTELDNENERVLVPNSKMLTDPIRVAKPPAQAAVR